MASVSTPADVAPKATELESKLKGKLFLGGDVPSADDVKAFEDLLGAHNTHLYRWVKHMASFTEQERSAWGEPGTMLATAEPEKEAPKAAASPAKEAKPKKLQSAVTFEVTPCAETTDLDALAAKLKSNKKPGLAWRSHKVVAAAEGDAKKLVLHLTVSDEKITAEDLDSIAVQYTDDVLSTEVKQWKKQ